MARCAEGKAMGTNTSYQSTSPSRTVRLACNSISIAANFPRWFTKQQTFEMTATVLFSANAAQRRQVVRPASE
jgi:hypothetical protein